MTDPLRPGPRTATPFRADLDKAPHDVAGMFDTVAEGYDRTNTVISAGLDRRWRAAMVRAVDATPGQVVLDIAGGTGVSAEPFAASGIQVVVADFSLGMVRVGKRRRPDLAFVVADATRLPFADNSFDAVTMSFGLRNVVDHERALREFHRVTRPGGRLVICEFSTPTWAPVRVAYQQVVLRVLPAVARRTATNPESYCYLAESIRAWPDQRALADRVAAAGWRGVQWRNLTGGVAALHRATRA